MSDVPQDCPATQAYDVERGEYDIVPFAPGFVTAQRLVSADAADAMREELLGKLAQARAQRDEAMQYLAGHCINCADEMRGRWKNPAPPAEEAR